MTFTLPLGGVDAAPLCLLGKAGLGSLQGSSQVHDDDRHGTTAKPLPSPVVLSRKASLIQAAFSEPLISLKDSGVLECAAPVPLQGGLLHTHLMFSPPLPCYLVGSIPTPKARNGTQSLPHSRHVLYHKTYIPGSVVLPLAQRFLL